MTNRVAKNVLVNFLGRGWGAFLSIALTPIYIKYLGIEAYALIGVFVTLQTLLSILDMGLGTAATREMAVLSVSKESFPKMRDFIRTLEWIYWGMAISIATLVAILAYPIAHFWVNPHSLQAFEINTAIILMGIVVAAQWPSSLYGGALMGLQHQISLNLINVLFSTIRAVGAILVLWKISPSIILFFLWQAFVSIIQTIVTAWYLWKQIKQTNHKPKFARNLLSETRKFATEMSGIALMAVAFTQLDKVVLSRLLSLEQFGYYYAASVAAGSLYILISPIFGAIFPKFSQLVSQQEKEQIKLLYDQASQLMAVTILPVMMIFVFFAYDLLLLWTHNKLTAENGAMVLGLLAIGNTLNGLMNVPYALQLATGDAKSVMKINASLIIVSVPAIIFLANEWGGIGAATAWVCYTFAFLVINTFVVHRKFSYLDNRNWLWNGVIRPAAVAFIIVFLGYSVRQIINNPFSQWLNFIIIILTAAVAVLVIAISSPQVIRYIKGRK